MSDDYTPVEQFAHAVLEAFELYFCDENGNLLLDLSEWGGRDHWDVSVSGAVSDALRDHPTVAVMHVTTVPDMETRAVLFNEGYEAAMSQQLADDPSAAGEWLRAHDAEVRAEQAEKDAQIAEAQRPESGSHINGSPYRDGKIDASRVIAAAIRGAAITEGENRG